MKQILPESLKQAIIECGHQIANDNGQDLPVFIAENRSNVCNCDIGVLDIIDGRWERAEHQENCIFRFNYRVYRQENPVNP